MAASVVMVEGAAVALASCGVVWRGEEADAQARPCNELIRGECRGRGGGRIDEGGALGCAADESRVLVVRRAFQDIGEVEGAHSVGEGGRLLEALTLQCRGGREGKDGLNSCGVVLKRLSSRRYLLCCGSLGVGDVLLGGRVEGGKFQEGHGRVWGLIVSLGEG